MKQKTVNVDAPADIDAALKNAQEIPDFLPPPGELVLKESKVKVTIALSSRGVDFFKEHAREPLIK